MGGTTGESVSLTADEREKVLELWVNTPEAKKGLLHVIAHVGCESLPDSVRLALHAEKQGVKAIAVMSPTFFKPKTD